MGYARGLSWHDTIIPLRKGAPSPPGVAQETRLERQGYELDLVVSNDSPVRASARTLLRSFLVTQQLQPPSTLPDGQTGTLLQPDRVGAKSNRLNSKVTLRELLRNSVTQTWHKESFKNIVSSYILIISESMNKAIKFPGH